MIKKRSTKKFGKQIEVQMKIVHIEPALGKRGPVVVLRDVKQF